VHQLCAATGPSAEAVDFLLSWILTLLRRLASALMWGSALCNRQAGKESEPGWRPAARGTGGERASRPGVAAGAGGLNRRRGGGAH